MRLLVIGLTLPTDGEVLGADAIRLVTLDFDQPSATIMAIPALLWVKTPTLVGLGVAETQLAAVYTQAYENKKLSSERLRHQLATQALAQTIVDNFGFVPDHYLTVDERTFVEAVDTLGGIQITLPEAVDGTSEEYGIYTAGGQTLDGMRTLNFARLFHPDGVEDLDTWGNMLRQKLVVQAILAEALKPKNFTKIPALADDLMRGVVTDLSLKQTLDLVCMVEKVGQNTQTLGVSEEMVTLDDSGLMIPDLEAIKQLIAPMAGSD
jgi:LCP family protein required for cell wall assembly